MALARACACVNMRTAFMLKFSPVMRLAAWRRRGPLRREVRWRAGLVPGSGVGTIADSAATISARVAPCVSVSKPLRDGHGVKAEGGGGN